MRTILIVLALLAFVGLILFAISSLEWVKPKDLTITTMICIEKNIRAYYAKTGVLPDKLESLPEYSDMLNDGWGNKIIYKASGDEVNLTSYGKNGNDKIFYTFNIKEEPFSKVPKLFSK